jgi:hypothetical protein
MSLTDAVRQDVKGRAAWTVEESGLCRRGARHAVARHWRHVRHLQRRPRGAADAAALRGAGAAGHGLEQVGQLRQDLGVQPGGGRLPHDGLDDDGGWILDQHVSEPDGCRRARAPRRRAGERQHLRRARRTAAAGPDVHDPTRIGPTARRSRAQSRGLAGAVCRRFGHRRPEDHAQRRAGGGHRRDARRTSACRRTSRRCRRADAVVAARADRFDEPQSRQPRLLRRRGAGAGADGGDGDRGVAGDCGASDRTGEYPTAMQFSAFAVGLDDEIRGEVRPAMCC